MFLRDQVSSPAKNSQSLADALISSKSVPHGQIIAVKTDIESVAIMTENEYIKLQVLGKCKVLGVLKGVEL